MPFKDPQARADYMRRWKAANREHWKELKRGQWRRKVEAAGKHYEPRGDQEAWRAQRRAEREKRKAEGLARLEQHNAELRAQAEVRREALLRSPTLICTVCGLTKDRDEFYPSRLRGRQVHCSACVGAMEAAKFQRNKDALSDDYVKRIITKHSGLRRRDIPQALIEAKRVQLMIERMMPRDEELFQGWLRRILREGPVDAETLNRMARESGFNTQKIELRHARRNAGAIYDATRNTWRLT